MLGTVTKVRDHPTHPVKVAIDFGDGALDAGWLMVACAAWATVQFAKLEGAQVSVIDTGHVGSDDKWRVTDFWPSTTLRLEANQKRIARAGDAIAISGLPKITAIQVAGLLAGLPEVGLLHDLEGEVFDRA
jgi:hypothetical protein